MGRPLTVILAAALICAALAVPCGCPSASASATSATSVTGAPSATSATSSANVTSNILRGDYAGSSACRGCHAEIYAAWSTSPMHEMTRTADAISGPFDGAVFSFKGDSIATSTNAGRRYMRVRSKKAGEQLYLVTQVIGGRVREDYAGVAVVDDSDASASAAALDDAKILPATYLLEQKRWRYKGYSVQVTERPGMEAGPVWRKTCVMCHNEVPYLATIYNALESPAHTVYQGSVSDIALPAARSYRVVLDDPAGLARAISDETQRLGAPVTSASAAALATRNHFGARDFVELGVGCESCHNGSRAHAESKGAVASSLVPASPLLHVELAGQRQIAPAQQVNHVCLRCHTVLFSQYSFTWEGGLRAQTPGGSTINSGEARDFQLGGCADQMSCVRCHDPHGRDARDKLDAMGTVAGNGLCISCHASIASDVSAHTHHASDSAGSACLACHMPKKNAGLDGNLTRYHRIGSPTDDARVLGDRPLECALCHADKSVSAIVDDMERLWGKRYDRTKLRALYGDDLEVNALVATVQRGHPHEQLVAADVLGARGTRAAIPALVDALPARVPLVRPYIKRAIERLSGKPLDVNLDDDADALAVAAHALYGAP